MCPNPADRKTARGRGETPASQAPQIFFGDAGTTPDSFFYSKIERSEAIWIPLRRSTSLRFAFTHEKGTSQLLYSDVRLRMVHFQPFANCTIIPKAESLLLFLSVSLVRVTRSAVAEPPSTGPVSYPSSSVRSRHKLGCCRSPSKKFNFLLVEANMRGIQKAKV